MITLRNTAQLARPLHEEPISGTVAAVAAYGIQVCYDPTGGNTRKLIPADKRSGFFLTQDVVTEADWKAEILKQEHFPSRLQHLSPVGQAVSARPWEEIHVEGSVHCGTSIDAGTVAGTKLTTIAGKWEEWVDVATSGDVTGIVDRVLTPITPGNFRLAIRRP